MEEVQFVPIVFFLLVFNLPLLLKYYMLFEEKNLAA